MKGFLEGAEFMRSFYRYRDTRDRLDRVEREKKKQAAAANDDDRIKPADTMSVSTLLRR
jgi:hypothetical protein